MDTHSHLQGLAEGVIHFGYLHVALLGLLQAQQQGCYVLRGYLWWCHLAVPESLHFAVALGPARLGFAAELE